jgi:hypothetical protein
MSRVLPAFAAVALMALGGSASANDAADFMARFSGAWLGTGQLLIGSDNGLKFHCSLNGDPSATQLTFNMSGRCWMGFLSAGVSAQLRYNAETNRFYGEFMDGSDGDGLDIVGSRKGEGFSLKLVRGEAQGRLEADAVNGDQLKVMMFYRDRIHNRELPVVAMGFARKDTVQTLPKYMPDMVTGSIAKPTE